MNSGKTILRRVGAVFGGLLVIIVTSTATDSLLHSTGVFPPWGQPMADSLFLFAIAYRTIYAVAGSYITARLAPERPMWHALVLGTIGVVLTAAGTAATWDRGPEFGPLWYPLGLIAITIPCSWAGGRLFDMQLRSQLIAPTYPSSQSSHA